jgi:hypothetical protein
VIIIKKVKCEHDWCFEKDWKKEVDIADFGHIVIPVKCSICKKRAFEVYEQIGYEDEDGEEIE